MHNLNKARQVVQAWYELNNHQKFENTVFRNKRPSFLIDPVLEDGSGCINDDDSKNVHLRYWYEIIVPELITTAHGEEIHMRHLHELDGSGDTYEDAVLKIHESFIDEFGKFEE